MLLDYTEKQQAHMRWILIIYLIVLNTHSFFLEPTHVSFLKVGLMALAPIFFIMYVPLLTKAFFCGLAYWGYCFMSAYMIGDMKFSTIGYMGLFVMTFITYYNILYQDVMNLGTFKKVLSVLIYIFAVCLLLQQACLLIGISNFPLINLIGESYMSLTKLPSLSLEPSHTAVILAFAYLCYLRCIQMEIGEKPSLTDMINRDNRWVTLGFLWVMLTMGSSSAFFALAILLLYFFNRKNAAVLISLMVLCILIIPLIENEQIKRVTKVSNAVVSGDREAIVGADMSAATRIMPLLNTFTKLDLSQKETWFGHGSSSIDGNYQRVVRDMAKSTYFVLPSVRQYGLIGWFLSIILVYVCCIRKFISIETLLWLTLGMATLGNIYFHWGIVMMMAGIRFYSYLYPDIGTEALNDSQEMIYETVEETIYR